MSDQDAPKDDAPASIEFGPLQTASTDELLAELQRRSRVMVIYSELAAPTSGKSGYVCTQWVHYGPDVKLNDMIAAHVLVQRRSTVELNRILLLREQMMTPPGESHT